MRIELFKGKGRHPWMLRLIGKNNETLAISEGYSTKWGAKRAAKKNFPGINFVDKTL